MYFLYKDITAFLCLATVDHTSALHFGIILNSEITNKKPQKWKKVLNTPQKAHLFTIWELKQEGRALPCLTSARNVHVVRVKIFATRRTSAN